MGNHISTFKETEEQSKSHTRLDTSQSDWITSHADLSGLAVVEVQRCWNRFFQLGGNKNGLIEKSVLEKSDIFNGQDIIIKNIISNLPKDKKGRLTFTVFLNFMRWLEEADTTAKLQVIHGFLNNGQELNDRTFTRILSRIYPDHSEEEINATVEILMLQLDPLNTGAIHEDQFVVNILKHYDEYELSEILVVDLIPLEGVGLEELKIRPKETSPKQSYRNSSQRVENAKSISLNDEQYINNELLEKVAQKAVNKDWERLAIKLGFLEYDIQSYKLKNKGFNYETMLDILITWRDQDPFLATKNKLRRYLEDTSMMDAAALLR